MLGFILGLAAWFGCSAPPTQATHEARENPASTSDQPETAAQTRAARSRTKQLRLAQLARVAAQRHGAMVRAKTAARCQTLRVARDKAVVVYAQALIGSLEDDLAPATARDVFARAAGASRAAWMAPAEQHRAQALMARAAATLWRRRSGGPPHPAKTPPAKTPPARTPPAAASIRLKRVQDAAAWALQLPRGDPTVQAWRAESAALAHAHARLRQLRAAEASSPASTATPFAALLQNKLVRELGGRPDPRAQAWLVAVIRRSSLRFNVRGSGACPAHVKRIQAALASTIGVPVTVKLRLKRCGDTAAGAAMRVLVGAATLTAMGEPAIEAPLALGASPPPPGPVGAARVTVAAIDAQISQTAAARIRAAAALIRAQLGALQARRARRAKTPLQAEEHWLRALAWADSLPPDGAAFLWRTLALTVAQARAAQSLRWSRPRLLLRIPTRPYALGEPHRCPAH